MDDELGTDPELLWQLLLAQLVYDELSGKKAAVNYDNVASKYAKHPLLPHNAPLLANGNDAETIYRELLADHKIDTTKTELEQCQLLAEPLYAGFHQSLLTQMENDIVEFEETYRRLEVQEDFPKDERLKEKQDS